MGRGRKKKDNPLDYITIPRLDIDPEIKRGIWALFLLVLGVVSVLALFDKAGLVGNYLSVAMIWTFGWGKWLFPVAILMLTWLVFNHERYEMRGTNYFGLFLFIFSFQGLLHVFINQAKWTEALELGAGGGHLGWLIALGLIKLVGFWASLILLIVLILIALMLTFNTTLASLLEKGSLPARFLMHPLKVLSGRKKDEEEDESEEEEEEEEDEEEDESEEEEEVHDEEELEEEVEEVAPIFTPQPVIAKTETKEKVEWLWQPTGVDVELPLSLLNAKSGKPRSGDIKASGAIIKKTLEEFGIEVEMGEVSVGPTVTQYTLKPADGVKLSRITALNNDLAMALAAHPVRIEAPIPGKSLVGIEVPNKSVVLVNLRSILNNELFKNRKTDTMVSLGKDVAGKCWLADIHKMPHLLVAGATGAGKSVMLNTLIVSLLYANNPDDLRFIMVDPKRVELTIYNDIPHLLTPVITDVGKTVNALKWCLNEMDRRFQVLAQAKKRDIDSYNAVAKQKMPYIIFIIDELADLMVVAAKDIETGIVRLAQMARAVGIHLVLATQRPSVNVITGTIKANMPARIAFSVASGIDSRTILDSLGAEKLLGKGDMLFSDATLPKPKRIQGAFVSDQEIKRVVKYLKSRAGSTFYLDGITGRQKVAGIGGVGIEGGGDDDELTSEAKEIVINAGKASATLLQRRLSVGYARAAKILDTLEEQGVIGPSQGAKPREVLVTKEQYESMSDQSVSGMPLHSQEDSQAPEEYLIGENDNEEEQDEAEENEDHEEEENEEDLPEEEAEEETEENEEDDDDDDETEAGEEADDDEAEDEEEEEAEELPEEDYEKEDDDDDDFDKYFSK